MDQRKGRLSPVAFYRLVRLARTFSPSIIQGHLFHSNVLSRFVSLLVPGALSVSTRHNEKDSVFRRVLYAMTGFVCAGTIVFSDSVLRHVSRDTFSGGSVRLVPYGIDPETPIRNRDEVRKTLGLGSDTFVWIAVGRLKKQKGFDLLIEAFSHLTDRGLGGTVLLVAGDGEEKEALEDQANRRGDGNMVRFLGERDDVVDLLGASDAFVLPSRWEGGPLVVLEAMASGLPVVATRVGDVRHMVADGKAGIIVPPENVRELSAAMEKITKLGHRARLWGAQGKEKIQASHHFVQTQKRMEDVYRDLAGFSHE